MSSVGGAELRVAVEIAGLDRVRWQSLEIPVDTRESLTVLPRTLLEGLGVAPSGSVPVEFPDGRTAIWDVGDVFIRIGDSEAPDTVFFGDEARLGRHTLAALLLTIDPATGRLDRATALMVGPHASYLIPHA